MDKGPSRPLVALEYGAGSQFDSLSLGTFGQAVRLYELQNKFGQASTMQAGQTLVAANAQIGAARAQYFPTVSPTPALGSASAELSGLLTGPARVWNYGGSIFGPIFTGGAIAGQVAQAGG